MIVRTLPSKYRLITQNDHAHWAYQLLSVWPALAQNPRRAAILEATRQHDRGWQGTDSSPLVQRSGKPHDFQTLPIAPREEVWRRGIEAPLEEGYSTARETTPTASQKPASSADSLARAWRELLICHHAWTIHHPSRTLPSRRESSAQATPSKPSYLPLLSALAAERRLRIDRFSQQLAELEEPDIAQSPWPSLAGIEGTLGRDYRWLATLDVLSLIVCNGWTDPFQLPDPSPSVSEKTEELKRGENEISAKFDGRTLTLDPFPLKGSYSLSLRSRDIPIRSYKTSSELSLALARSTWYTEEIRVLAI